MRTVIVNAYLVKRPARQSLAERRRPQHREDLLHPALQVEAVSRSGSGGHRWMFHARTGPDTLNARSSGSARSSYARCPSSVFRRRDVTLPKYARTPLLGAQPFRSRPTPVTINRMLMSQTKVRCEKRMRKLKAKVARNVLFSRSRRFR